MGMELYGGWVIIMGDPIFLDQKTNYTNECNMQHSIVVKRYNTKVYKEYRPTHH